MDSQQRNQLELLGEKRETKKAILFLVTAENYVFKYLKNWNKRAVTISKLA